MNITQDFIDERFQAYILETYCENRDQIQSSDVERIVSLQLANQRFSSLKGIEHFTSLEELDCSFNSLTELDMSHNIHLKELNCNKNEIHSLDLSNNGRLEIVDCGFNRIRKLDVSQNTMLSKLDCYWNIISELLLDQNPQLKELNCSYNSLFDLHLDQNTQLTYLECANNYLISLNIKNCSLLTEIRCNHNHLTHLDVTANPALESLRCFHNHIRELDLSHNAHLAELYCSENKIAKLDTSQNPKLETLDHSNNLITWPAHTLEEMGTFAYDVSLSTYASTLVFKGRELFVRTAASTEDDMKRLSPMIKNAWQRFDELNERALEQIASAHPDEDVTELVLSELVFEKDGSFCLGYDAGDTPAGHLFIYVVFTETLEMDSELLYEIY